MGNDFDPGGLPKTMEEVIKRERETDTLRTTRALERISKIRKTPPKKLGKNDIFDVQQMSYYINEMYEAEDVRSRNEGKHYPVIDEEFREYIREQANLHRIHLLKRAAKKQQAKVAKVSTFVVCMLVVVMFTAQGVSTFAFGYDLFGSIVDWGKTVLRIPSDTSVSQGDITVIKNDKTTTYANINEAIDSLDVNILFPTYLPDGISINEIYIAEDKVDNIVYTVIWLLFNDDNYQMWISSNQKDYNPDIEELTTIGKYKCKINYLEDSYQVNFIESNYLYSIICSDYEILVKIVENLKYN